MPQAADLFLGDDLEVGNGRMQYRIPVDQTLAAVDQIVLVQRNEDLSDRARQIGIQREPLTAPIHRRTHATQLAGDGAS